MMMGIFESGGGFLKGDIRWIERVRGLWLGAGEGMKKGREEEGLCIRAQEIPMMRNRKFECQRKKGDAMKNREFPRDVRSFPRIFSLTIL